MVAWLSYKDQNNPDDLSLASHHVARFALERFGQTRSDYNEGMQRKVFWTVFGVLGLVADLALPFWWAMGATIPLAWVSWWVAYRSDWF